jgi:D-alanyl-D-alanine carboxypeptidase (penicillin-binding protein 5/6)
MVRSHMSTMPRSRKLWMSCALLVVVGVALAFIAVYYSHKEPVAVQPAAVVVATTTAAPAPNAFAGMRISGQAAIVVDLSTGQTLYSENADTQLPLASLTKLLSLYAATSALSSNSVVTISSSSLAQDGDYGFSEGETFYFKDLARLALVASSNDAAEAITEAAASAKSLTIEQLLANAASDAGLSRTTATNGTGLDVDTQVSGGYGTARDVAKLASLFLKRAPAIAGATTLPSVTARSISGTAHTLHNTNPDTSAIPGILMSKTGFTDLAGGNLVIIFDAGIDHPVAIVVLGSTRDARFTDVERLMHATLAQFAGVSAPGTPST